MSCTLLDRGKRALASALCIGMRSLVWSLRQGLAGYGKSSWRNGASSKIAIGRSIPIYIASESSRSQFVRVGFAQARPNDIRSDRISCHVSFMNVVALCKLHTQSAPMESLMRA